MLFVCKGIKPKGRYVVLGLPNSGKASLLKQLNEEGLIDSLPLNNGESKPFVFRFVEEVGQATFLGARQCRKNYFITYAQG